MTSTRTVTTFEMEGGSSGGQRSVNRSGGSGGSSVTTRSGGSSVTKSGGSGEVSMQIIREGQTQGEVKSEAKMLQAEEVARAKVTSIKQEAENDTRTIEDPPNPRSMKWR